MPRASRVTPKTTATKRRVNRPGSKKRKKSKLEEYIAGVIAENGWPTPCREVTFHEPGNVYAKRRKYRFDFAWPDLKLAIEADGGAFKPNSGHRSPKGMTDDRRKDMLAQLQGWTILRFNEIHIREGDVVPFVAAALAYCQTKAPTEFAVVETGGDDDDE